MNWSMVFGEKVICFHNDKIGLQTAEVEATKVSLEDGELGSACSSPVWLEKTRSLGYVGDSMSLDRRSEFHFSQFESLNLTFLFIAASSSFA